MYKFFDYTCRNCNLTEERMVSKEEENHVTCNCGNKMVKEVPAPYGKVLGTNNPVSQLK